MSKIYNKHMDLVIRSVEPTLGQEKTKAFKRNLESKKLFKKAEEVKKISQLEKKAKGGRVGRKGGGDLGMQSVKYGLDNKPEITALDPKAKFIAAAKSDKPTKPMGKSMIKSKKEKNKRII